MKFYSTFFVIFCVYNCLVFADNSTIASTCTPEKIEKVGECAQKLVSTVEKLSKWVDQDYKFNEGEKKDFKNNCEETQNCFNTVKSNCPDFPDVVTQDLDVMCSRFNFIIGDFNECLPKVVALNQIDCVKIIFGTDTMKKSQKEKCETISKNRKCAREQVEKVCGDQMGAILDKNLDEELQLHKC